MLLWLEKFQHWHMFNCLEGAVSQLHNMGENRGIHGHTGRKYLLLSVCYDMASSYSPSEAVAVHSLLEELPHFIVLLLWGQIGTPQISPSFFILNTQQCLLIKRRCPSVFFKDFIFIYFFSYVCYTLSCVPLKGIYLQLSSKGNVFSCMPEILSVCQYEQ